MKLALLGGPGSGKTVIGRRLVSRLHKTEPWALIDGYVEKFCTRTGQTAGVQATYLSNVQLITERVNLEQEAQLKEVNTVTCGSIYESLIYTGVLGTVMPANEQDRIDIYSISQAFMTTLGYLERLTFDYDVLFFLPLPPELAEAHTWEAVVNAKIPEVLEGLFKAAILLDGTPRQNVDYAEQIVRNIQHQQAQVPALSEENGVEPRV